MKPGQDGTRPPANPERRRERAAKITALPRRKKRVLGGDAGRGWIADDFDAPLPRSIQKLFEK
jgi:hypothetical protein